MHPDDTIYGEVKNGVLILSGTAASVSVQGMHLVIKDGVRGAEIDRRFARATCPISRLISTQLHGYVSIAAMHWLRAVGAALIVLDYDGTPVFTTVPQGSVIPAALRRAQAALTTETPLGASIARCLIETKIAGQIEVLRAFSRMDHAAAAEAQTRGLASKREARILYLLGVEGKVSAVYWQGVADLPLSFGKRQTIPDYWRKFGSRQSPLTGENRRAVTPGNALLNYLYSVAASEIVIALHAAGLDPALGVLHTDKDNRASVAQDLLEACRPYIDRWFFHWLQTATFSKRDFFEDGRGGVRLMRPLPAHLAMTSVLWRELASQVVTWFYARLSGKTASLRLQAPSLAADARRRAARWRLGKTIAWTIPQLCQECGRALPRRSRRFCSRECMISYYGGPSVEAGLAAIARARAAGMKARPRRPALRVDGVPSVAEWRQRPDWSAYADDDMRRKFVSTVLPKLVGVRPSDIARTMG